jgi:hypothetical protein
MSMSTETETIQDALDYVWSEYRLSDPWWENQPDAAFQNELESVKGLATYLRDHNWDPAQIFDIIISRVEFKQPDQEQWLIYGFAALEHENHALFEKFWKIFIPDGLDFYMVYWMAYNRSSPSSCLEAGAELALDTEDPELLELMVRHPNLSSPTRTKCQELLEELS